MKKKSVVFLFLMLNLYGVSCIEKNEDCCKKKGNHSRQVELTIPLDRNGEKILYYKLVKQISYQLRLDSLELGLYPLQVRLWGNSESKPYIDLVVIKKCNNSWKGKFYTMSVEWDDTHRTETVYEKHSRTIFPISGWKKFIDSLNSLKIEELPNMDAVPEMNGDAIGGNRVFMEIATESNYRFLNYSNLIYYLPRNDWPASNMAKIVGLFNKEFDLNLEL